jgi:uncharacterized protein YjhX (UPF0386 family)
MREIPPMTERVVYSTETQQTPKIRLFSADRKLLSWVAVDVVERMKGVKVTFSKAGAPVRAQILPLTCHIRPVLTSAGMAFQQHLPSGVVYALRGVRGSA